jgi:hypothetical protein
MRGAVNNRVHFVDTLLKSSPAMQSPHLVTCSQYLLLQNFVALIQIIYDELSVLQIPCHCQLCFSRPLPGKIEKKLILFAAFLPVRIRAQLDWPLEN